MNNFLHGNWVDLIIGFILLYFVLDSFRHNFFVTLIEFLSFLASLLLGLRLYGYLANTLIANFSLPNSIAKAIGFILVVTVVEWILATLLYFLVKKIPEKLRKLAFLNYFRFIIGFFDGILLLSFLIPLVLAFPIPSSIKADISSSKMGGFISGKTAVFEKRYAEIFGDVISDGLNLLTVGPKSGKSISLNIGKKDLSVDYESEENMLKLVNIERQKIGLKLLISKDGAISVARDYAKDMWERGYFSHFSPEGEDISVRLEKSGIKFNSVGENLALAPTLLVAHNGLMNSEGHRSNILNPIYTHLAIGVIDNGVYGKIFVQIFTD